ncbi:MAG: OmpA family protein, partial [Halobacteriovoraceae bacterium]|nr:OmpA family protein [Halobacteriovoraceae bacterium]
FERLVKMLSSREWTVFVEGHAGKGEFSANGKLDAFSISSKRAAVVARHLIKRGVRPDKITTVFYGDTRPEKGLKRSSKISKDINRRVEFLLRKVDLRSEGKKVDSR